MTRLTKTQSIILRAAAGSSAGAVGFHAGDRKGTRVVRVDDLGRPWVKAYGNPEWFLKARGLLEQSNEHHVYRITAAGRAAVSAVGP